MRVLYIAVSSEGGGAGRSMLEMISTIKKRYPEVEPVVLCSHKHGHIDKFREQEIEAYPTLHEAFNFGRDTKTSSFIIKYIPRFVRYVVRDLYALIYIKKNIDMKKIDLIHTNAIRNDIGMILAKKYNIPHILHLREFGTKGFDYDVRYFRINPIKYVDERVSHYIAITNAVKKHWVEYNCIDPKKITVVYNGINETDIIKREQQDCDRNNEPFRIVMTGYFTQSKGQEELIRALTFIPTDVINRIKVDFIGSGDADYIDNLKKIVRDAQIEGSVSFLGHREDVHKILHNYDLGIICSRAEAFGRVTAEYMLAGLCVLASNTGGNLELIEDKKTGCLYEYGNPQSLSDKICFLFNNRDYVDMLSENGYEKAKRKYITQKNAEGVVNVYRKLMGKE